MNLQRTLTLYKIPGFAKPLVTTLCGVMHRGRSASLYHLMTPIYRLRFHRETICIPGLFTKKFVGEGSIQFTSPCRLYRALRSRASAEVGYQAELGNQVKLFSVNN